MLRFCSLASGSSGNATLVEARSGHQSSRLLIDCGLGIRLLEAALVRAGLHVSELDGVFITHEHADHTGCVRALCARHRLPLWSSEGTWRGLGCPPELAPLWRGTVSGEWLSLGALAFMPFAVPHDSQEPLQLVLADGAVRLGVATDLGHAPLAVQVALQGCQALLLEANHDPDLLAASPYPAFLRRRIAGPHGHLSNAQAAELLRRLAHPGLGPVVAAHLSAQNNTPRHARAALAGALGREEADITVASPRAGTGWITVGA